MSEPTPTRSTASIDNLRVLVAQLLVAIEELKELTLHDCEGCKHPTYQCACSDAVNANTAIKEG
jgi:hypothetical protein